MPVHFTQRAFRKTRDIHKYSKKHWGKIVADDYLVDLNHEALKLQNRHHPKPGRAKPFLMASVREHFLIYDVFDEHIYVVEVFG